MCSSVSTPAKWESWYRKAALWVSTTHGPDTLNSFQMNNSKELACLTGSDNIIYMSVTVMGAWNINVCVTWLQKYQPLQQNALDLHWPKTRGIENERRRGRRGKQREAGWGWWVGGRGWCRRSGVKEQAWKMKCTNGVDGVSTKEDGANVGTPNEFPPKTKRLSFTADSCSQLSDMQMQSCTIEHLRHKGKHTVDSF